MELGQEKKALYRDIVLRAARNILLINAILWQYRSGVLRMTQKMIPVEGDLAFPDYGFPCGPKTLSHLSRLGLGLDWGLIGI